MTSPVVIGANFGDEGKGLITDFECRRLKAARVVRFNGGAQAGHTVCTDDGRRHVFGHVSSGTFAGASTYLGRKFIVNPLVLDNELNKLSPAPYVDAHPQAMISTIYDMLLNGAAEITRAGARHGSCGLGINETVTRHTAGFALTIKQVRTSYHTVLTDILKKIHTEYVPRRIQELGIDLSKCPQEMVSLLQSTNYADHAMRLRQAAARITIMEPDCSDEPVVFEGAQGLMLDEFLGTFPHVTRSMTGLPYALLSAFDLGITKVQPIYVTRAYCTRHGAGILPFEGEAFDTVQGDLSDMTNVPNEWQGTLRYAPLNVTKLSQFITQDLSRAEHIARTLGIEIAKPALAVTCLDQINGDVRLMNNDGYVWRLKREHFAETLAKHLHLNLSHSSWGPTASHVRYELK